MVGVIEPSMIKISRCHANKYPSCICVCFSHRRTLGIHNMHPSTCFTPRIPYDILVSIIDELALRGQLKDLRACSQACHMLLHPCRVNLFSAVTVGVNVRRFAALLNQNSTIQVYIRNLTYQPAILSEDIANALLLLNNIETLSLQGYMTSSWGSLTPQTQHALIHLFSSPSVTRILVYGFADVPAILLSSCSNLKHLDLHSPANFTSEASNTPFLAPPKLISLDISKVRRPAVESLLNERRVDGLPILDLSGHRSLTVRLMQGPGDEKHLEQILRSASKLQHLGFTGIFITFMHSLNSDQRVPR